MNDKSGVLIYNENKVLLVHQRNSNLWSIPKGHSNPGENLIDCWKRELFEETGLKYIPCGKIQPNLHYFNGYRITVIRTFAKYLPSVHPNDVEVTEAKWVGIKEIHKYPLNGVTSKIIYEIIENPTPDIKTY